MSISALLDCDLHLKATVYVQFSVKYQKSDILKDVLVWMNYSETLVNDRRGQRSTRLLENGYFYELKNFTWAVKKYGTELLKHHRLDNRDFFR